MMENSDQPQQVVTPPIKKPKMRRQQSERSAYIGKLIKGRPKGMSAREAMSVYSKQAKEFFATKQKLKK